MNRIEIKLIAVEVLSWDSFLRWDTNSARECVRREHPYLRGGGEGVLKKVLYWRARPRGPNPYPFHLNDMFPFLSILQLTKSLRPLSYTSSLRKVPLSVGASSYSPL